MTKFFITFLFAVCVHNIFGQITLTSAITPRPGDMQYRVRADTAGINPGNPGPNQNWNFNVLNRVDSSVSVWLSAANTPYGSLFPDSKIAMLDTCYSYFDTSAARVDYLGQYTQGTAIPYTNYQTIITYPCGYNSLMNDNFAAVINQNGDVIHRTGTVILTGDAWGTIHLPFGTYNNALRLKHQITTRDSSANSNFVLITNYTTYEWYVPGRKFSVFSITYININILQDNITLSFKSCFYNPSSSVIGITNISSQVPDVFCLYQNFPNPFNPSTKIKFDIPCAVSFDHSSGNAVLKLYDIQGKEVLTLVNEQLAAGSYLVDFNADGLSSGVYFYRLNIGNFSQTRKLNLLK